MWLVGSGCGGLNVSKSVSPVPFFMPGVLQAEPPGHAPEQMCATNEPAKLLAQGR
jgi:hypothetical protein